MLAPARKSSLVRGGGGESEERGRTVDEAEEVDQGDGREDVPVDLAGETTLRFVVNFDDSPAVLVGSGMAVKGSFFDCGESKSQ
jgi:hypothetical protein